MLSHGGICNIADNYMCIESETDYVAERANGQYRQLHDNAPYWISVDTPQETSMSVVSYQRTLIFLSWTEFYHELVDSDRNVLAWCFICGGLADCGDMLETGGSAYRPWECVGWGAATDEDEYTSEVWFDVDECLHPNATNQTVDYPEYLCLSPDDVDDDSLYQGMRSWTCIFGVCFFKEFSEMFLSENHVTSCNLQLVA